MTRAGMAVGMAAALAWASPALAEGSAKQKQSGQQAQGRQAQGQQAQQLPQDLQTAIQDLHADNQAEIKLGQTAQKKSQSPQVKQLAQQTIQQHQQVDQQLKKAARQLGVQLQGPEYQAALQQSQQEAQELQQKSGAEFDRAYLAQVIDEHEQDLSKLHDAAMKAGEASQPQLAKVFGDAEAAMHQHFAQAQKINQQLQQQGVGGSGQGGSGSQQGSTESQESPGSTGSW